MKLLNSLILISLHAVLAYCCQEEATRFLKCVDESLSLRPESELQKYIRAAGQLKQCLEAKNCDVPESLSCEGDACYTTVQPRGNRKRRMSRVLKKYLADLTEEQTSCVRGGFIDSMRQQLLQCTAIEDWTINALKEFEPEQKDAKKLPRIRKGQLKRSCRAAKRCIKRVGVPSKQVERQSRKALRCNGHTKCIDSISEECKDEIIQVRASICSCGSSRSGSRHPRNTGNPNMNVLRQCSIEDVPGRNRRRSAKQIKNHFTGFFRHLLMCNCLL